MNRPFPLTTRLQRFDRAKRIIFFYKIESTNSPDMVLVHFASPECRPRVAREVLVTEPRAVATGSKHSTGSYRSFCQRNCRPQIEYSPGRYRSRFCNDSPMLLKGIN